MTALKQQLEAIAVSSGYNTNLGDNLLYWQDFPTEYAVHALVYRDLAEEPPEERNLDHEHLLHIEIEGRTFSETPGVTANNMLEDIAKAIAVDPTLSKKAIKIIFAGNETDVETEGKTAARVLFKLDVLYRTPKYEV